ncbi:MAG: hypothetical protein WC389_10970 [Lutibacter sp.]|jgi:hypothetical protein
MANNKELIERLKEYTSVLVGSRTTSAYDGSCQASYKQAKGQGHLVIHLGDIKIDKNGESQINKMLDDFIQTYEQLKDSLTTTPEKE